MPPRRQQRARSALARYAVLGVAIAAWHLTALPALVTSAIVSFMPVSHDVEIGLAFVEQSGLGSKVVRSRLLDEAVGAISRKVLGALSRAERERFVWQFSVVEDESVNAFALPGGLVYLNLGLLLAASSAEELAGVLAHEVGHVLCRHGQQRMVEERLVGTLLEALLHEDGDEEDEGFVERLAETLTRGALQLGGLRFSRRNELEADARGAALLRGAGVGVGGMAAFFESLLHAEARAPGSAPPPAVSGVQEWLSTHPATAERVRTLRAQVDGLPEAERRRAWSGSGRISQQVDMAAVRREAQAVLRRRRV